MSAYVIVQVDVKDPVRYEDYKKMVPPSLEKYGGTFLRPRRQDPHDGRRLGSEALRDRASSRASSRRRPGGLRPSTREASAPPGHGRLEDDHRRRE